MKVKRLLSFLFILVFLVVLAVPSFATDVSMDGTNGDASPLFSFIPIKSFTIRSYYAGATDSLDIYMFSSGGFLYSGQIQNETMIIDYNFNDTQVEKSVVRTAVDSESCTIKEVFVVEGEDSHNTFKDVTGFQITVYFEDFWFQRVSGSYPMMGSPYFFLNADGSNDSFSTLSNSGAQVLYSGFYRRAQFNDAILDANRIDFDFQRESFTYKDLTQYTNSVSLCPSAMFDTLTSLAKGTADDFSETVLVEDLTATFLFTASTDVLGFLKRFGIFNYYYTDDYFYNLKNTNFYEASFSENVDAIISDGPVFIDEIPVGEFLDNSIRPFLETPIYGWFSIGDLLGGVLGLALLIAFLKFFAGG